MDNESNTLETLQAFHRASDFVSNPEAQSKGFQLTTSDKLHFYSLFKIVTTSGGGPLKTPSFWDFEGKAKVEAWKSAKIRLEGLIKDDSKNTLVELAAREYMEKARHIGWDDSWSKSVDYSSKTQDWKTADAEQNGLAIELSKFLEEGGLNDLQISNEELDEDSHDESTPDGSQQNDNEDCSRDEYGLEIDSTDETADTEILQQGSSALFNSSNPEPNPPALNMISVSRMLDTAESNNKSSEGPTSLHDLVIENDQVGVEQFIDNALQTDGKGQLDCIINQFNTDGYTPLHLACDRGHISIVQLLIKSGANPCLKDQQDDLTAQELAREAGMAEVENYLDGLVVQA